MAPRAPQRAKRLTRPARELMVCYLLVAAVHLVALSISAIAVASVTQVLAMPLLAGYLWVAGDRSRLVCLTVLLALGVLRRSRRGRSGQHR